MKIREQDYWAVLEWIKEGLDELFAQPKELRKLPFFVPLDGQGLVRLATTLQEIHHKGIAGDEELLEAVHRMDSLFVCPAYWECPLESCEGIVWCKHYNLGSSHGYQVRKEDLSREEHKARILARLAETKR